MSLLKDMLTYITFKEPGPPPFELIDKDEKAKKQSGGAGQEPKPQGAGKGNGKEEKPKETGKDTGKQKKGEDEESSKEGVSKGEGRGEGKEEAREPGKKLDKQGQGKAGKNAKAEKTGEPGSKGDRHKGQDDGRDEDKRYRFKKLKKPERPKPLHDEFLPPDVYINDDVRLYSDIELSKSVLELIFRKPKNMDIVFREFSINTEPQRKAMLVYYDGMTDRNVQNLAILQPLMLLAGLRVDKEGGPLELFTGRLLPGSQLTYAETYKELAEGILAGSTAVLFDNCPKAVLVETKGWANRGVEKPENEAIIRGPQEAFTETFRTNTALIRKMLHAPDLITEMIRVGTVTRTIVGVMYLESVANPELVQEVMRRLSSIKTAFAIDSGMVEQLIEDHPYALTPQVIATERPDRAVASLVEGQVVIVVDNSPYVLIAPATFYSLFQTGEDAYLRWPLGSVNRLIRFLGLLIATFLPGFFIAVTTFHHEMIPTDLLMSIAGNREKVPFPSIVELLAMELAFELIREAGIRIPGVVGTTLGIVGALILGQAAVAANVVSPITIIVVAVTAIGTFTIPNYPLSYVVRVIRFVYILLAGVLGMFGVVLGAFIQFGFLTSVKSFGVAYFAPVSPTTRRSQDVITRGQLWSQEYRPDYLNTQKEKLQPEISRGWLKRRLKQKSKA